MKTSNNNYNNKKRTTPQSLDRGGDKLLFACLDMNNYLGVLQHQVFFIFQLSTAMVIVPPSPLSVVCFAFCGS